MFQRPGGPAGIGSAGNAAQLKIHDVQCTPDDCISRVRWSPASCPIQLLGATSWDKTVRVWQIQAQGDVVQSQPMAMTTHSMPVLDMSFTADGRAFFGGCCKSAMEWNLTTNQTRQVAAHDLPISCLEYVNTQVAQEMLITASWDGKVRFWDLRQQAPAKEENFGLGPIMCMDAKTSPMATFCTGRKIIVYNLQTMTTFTQLAPHNMMKYNLRGISNLQNQTGFFTGSSEGRAALVPLNQAPVAPGTASPSCCFKAHCVEQGGKQFVMYPTNFVGTHPGSTAAVTGGADGCFRFWSLTTKSRTFESAARTHNGQPVPISSGDLNANGSLLAYSTSYDWSMGKDGFDPTQPRAVSVVAVNPVWLK